MTFVSKCRIRREEAGYTLKDVADRTGYSKMNISNFERGYNNNAFLLAWYMLYCGVTAEDMEGAVRYDSRPDTADYI